MNEADFKERTRKFGLRVIRVVEALPKGMTSDVVGRQLLRSATSVGANYRAACRARSKAEMAARLAVVEEEADESKYWMEMLVDAGLIEAKLLRDLLKESDEIVALTVASIRTLRGFRSGTPGANPKSKI
jgi:four helix bundle protein